MKQITKNLGEIIIEAAGTGYMVCHTLDHLYNGQNLQAGFAALTGVVLAGITYKSSKKLTDTYTQK